MTTTLYHTKPGNFSYGNDVSTHDQSIGTVSSAFRLNQDVAVPSQLCTNETLLVGICYGMPVCGFCYDFGQFHKPSREYEIYNLAIIGVILPTMGIFGLIGNSISAFIYSRKSMQSSLNVYLCALAFSDMTIVSTSFFLFFLESLRKRHALVSKYYALLAPIMFPLGLTAQSLSVFLTIAAAFDCYVLVTATERMRQRCCSVRTSKWAICGILITACCFNLPHLFEITVVNCWSVPYKMPSFDVCPTELRQNETYYTLYYAYLYTIVMAAGPVILLIIINSLIICSLRDDYRKREMISLMSNEQKLNGNEKLEEKINNKNIVLVTQQFTKNFVKMSKPTSVSAYPNSCPASTAAAAFLSTTATTPVMPTLAETHFYGSTQSIESGDVDAKLSTSNKNDKADVMTLVLVVCLFISCNILPLTVNFLELMFNLVNSYLIDLSNLMVVLNSSCNFLIYYAFCQPFNSTLKMHLGQISIKLRKIVGTTATTSNAAANCVNENGVTTGEVHLKG